jgi:DNA-binding GntR family transcriptional regulator
MRLAAEQAAVTAAAQKSINEAALAQLREELDNILEYQADRAPSWVSLEGAEYPEKEGSLKDFLAAR